MGIDEVSHQRVSHIVSQLPYIRVSIAEHARCVEAVLAARRLSEATGGPSQSEQGQSASSVEASIDAHSTNCEVSDA